MEKFKILEGLELQNTSNTTKSNVLGYDSSTGEVTYQAAGISNPHTEQQILEVLYLHLVTLTK